MSQSQSQSQSQGVVAARADWTPRECEVFDKVYGAQLKLRKINGLGNKLGPPPPPLPACPPTPGLG